MIVLAYLKDSKTKVLWTKPTKKRVISLFGSGEDGPADKSFILIVAFVFLMFFVSAFCIFHTWLIGDLFILKQFVFVEKRRIIYRNNFPPRSFHRSYYFLQNVSMIHVLFLQIFGSFILRSLSTPHKPCSPQINCRYES